MKPALTSTLQELAHSALNDDPNKVVEYQLGISITDRSIEGYLSDLERFINNLLMLKQEARPRVANSLKDNITVYSKPVPNAVSEEMAKEKLEANARDDQKLMDEGKFREYAMEYWDKRRNKAGNASQVKDSV